MVYREWLCPFVDPDTQIVCLQKCQKYRGTEIIIHGIDQEHQRITPTVKASRDIAGQVIFSFYGQPGFCPVFSNLCDTFNHQVCKFLRCFFKPFVIDLHNTSDKWILCTLYKAGALPSKAQKSVAGKHKDFQAKYTLNRVEILPETNKGNLCFPVKATE